MGKEVIELVKTCKQISRKYPLLTEPFSSLVVWEETNSPSIAEAGGHSHEERAWDWGKSGHHRGIPVL